MASFDYLESRDDADELIEEFGATAIVRKITTSGPAHEPVETTTDYATKAVKIEFTLRQIESGNVLDTDERWLVAAGPLAALGVTSIAPPDSLVVGDVVKPIIRADPLAPAGVTVMYDCQIRV